MSLEEQRQTIIHSIQDDLGVIAGGYGAGEIATSFESLSESFQGLAACNLLLSAEPSGFFKNLIMSGYTRRNFLSRCRREGVAGNEYLAISRGQSVLDVLATGCLPLAQEIVSLSIEAWIPDGEYEDDFCYYWFLHNLVSNVGSPDRERLEGIIERFSECVAEDTTERLSVCQSLLSRQPVEFDEALIELLELREGQIEAQRPIAGDDPGFEARAAVFVEGLALLRLATSLGLSVSGEYLLCPEVARAEFDGPLPEDIYEEIDRISE